MKHANSIKLELVCKKISWRILPLIVLMFCLSMLDRTNISFVKSHIEIDAGIGEAAYALGAGIFFIGYAIFEVPSNLFLHKLGAKNLVEPYNDHLGSCNYGNDFYTRRNKFLCIKIFIGFN